MAADGKRPDEPVVVDEGGQFGVIAAYPTKLAFAPLLAERVLEIVRASKQAAASDRGDDMAAAFKGFERPPIAELPWERGGVEWR